MRHLPLLISALRGKMKPLRPLARMPTEQLARLRWCVVPSSAIVVPIGDDWDNAQVAD